LLLGQSRRPLIEVVECGHPFVKVVFIARS
jgi:hypothetical protein